MAIVKSFADIDEYLDHLNSKTIRGSYKLDRMHELMAFLGDPQKNLKIIHVAGTSGKTSTSYYIASILTKAGYKTGLTISPHVDEVNERLQINLEPLQREEYFKIFKKFTEIVEAFNQEITYFELFIAMSFWYFNLSKVDYAIIEVGIGGLLDSTNIAKGKDKICVITDIGIDHTQYLGNTIEEIAKQKAGIIMQGNVVFMNHQNDIINNIIKQTTDRKNATLNYPETLKIKVNLACLDA